MARDLFEESKEDTGNSNRDLFSELQVNEPKSTSPKMSPWQAGLASFNTSAGSLPRGIIQALAEKGLLGDQIKGGYERFSNNENQRLAQALQQHPVASTIGNFAGTLAGSSPLFAIPGTLPLKGALGGASYGLLNETKPGESRRLNEISGGLLGGALTSAPGLLKGGANLIGKGINAIRPQKLANEFLEKLGEGRTWGENASNVAEGIQGNRLFNEDISSRNYNPIMSNAGKQFLNKDASHGLNLDPDLESDINLYSRHVRDELNNFKNNPTIENAHALQSKMGEKAAEIKGSDAVGREKETGKDLSKLQKEISNKIKFRLKEIDPMAAKEYQKATIFHKQNVIPYRQQPVRSIAYDQNNSIPQNISKGFSKYDKNIQRAVSDLGDSGKNKIYYDALGKITKSKDPNALLNFLKEDIKMEKFRPDDYDPFTAQLSRALRNKKIAQRAAIGIPAIGGTVEGLYHLLGRK